MANTVTLKTVGKGDCAGAFSLYATDGGRKYVNAAERRRVLEAIAALDLDKALFAELLVWTGARVSEILSERAQMALAEAGTGERSDLNGHHAGGSQERLLEQF